MSIDRKVALVRECHAEYGLSRALAAVDLARSTWHYRSRRPSYVEKHAQIATALLAVAEVHPDYGYRRATTEVAALLRKDVNSKVVRKLSSQLGLTAIRRKRPRKNAVLRQIESIGSKANLVATLESVDPFRVFFTDFTEIRYAHGKACLMAVLEWQSRWIPGFALGRRRSRKLALEAWTQAKRALVQNGLAVAGVIVHHDRDSVYTSEQWVRQLLIDDRARLSYALHGARDNPEMESFHGRFKEENGHLFDQVETFEELETVVAERMKYYTLERRHSAIGNVAPWVYAQRLLLKSQ